MEVEKDDAFHAAKKALSPRPLRVEAITFGLQCLSMSSHVMEEGEERPIAYTVVEKNYSQLEKEDLAIIFVVRKFHNYLFG